MVSKEFTIKNKMGFHMRPANVFVTEMTKYASSVNIIFNGKTINGKSIMNIMALASNAAVQSPLSATAQTKTKCLLRQPNLLNRDSARNNK